MRACSAAPCDRFAVQMCKISLILNKIFRAWWVVFLRLHRVSAVKAWTSKFSNIFGWSLGLGAWIFWPREHSSYIAQIAVSSVDQRTTPHPNLLSLGRGEGEPSLARWRAGRATQLPV